ncbi:MULTISPECIES: BMP family ABC transporter substrate-binding protein [unclassified Undibacterium]|uniref:BMP family ABC transporter substrate-binding protein n=1 Tax=unclassified Undibacterium TaxID=2630295 RepID=UPI002AC94A14|nr:MULTISPECIES: BMP family ABC transporter substrate-binding protein [unclassified Undibacterium]MEB0140566.1 BMP family ABC transporter substrate-binding protein [Undibacterium sp. CCC2.1]MEB0173614.1 BMP family ABC transporter substrate-binding protein [Undibacterium sp. CCC1.1]MEB0177575.1 BMP family ABC transporter substrate-binding protein [Undibacterium sp. CCC3.4]MEB0216743.1 BMP family ABC transporter substrate-binding protein [Undibacterium sp. 5I2]WPX44708.1 BMP family ABC transport
MKISRRKTLVAALSLALLSLAACGKKEEAKPDSAAPAAAASTATATVEPLKVGFIYVGPVGDAGWTYAHDAARKLVEAKFGDKVKTTFVENVPESAADAERVIRDLATQGNKVIFGTTFGYMEAMLKVAKDFPDVKFEHATGYKTAANLAQYDVRTYEGAYLAGVAAGKLSKSGKLGIVASVPIPEVLRNINSFELGARSVNPKATTKVVWVNKWFDPGKEREAAITLVGQGVDVLMQNTDSAAVVQTAEEKGVMAFGWDSDMSKFGPKAHVAASTIDWSGYYISRIDAAMAGTWKSESTWWGLKENMIDLKAFNGSLSEEVKKLIADKRQGVIDGTAPIWKGPIKDNTGKEVLGKDVVADDKFLHEIKFYVEGVEGKVPG